MTFQKTPHVVQVAERFLWEMMLTEKWDHLFRKMDFGLDHDSPFPGQRVIVDAEWLPREGFFGIDVKIWSTPPGGTRKLSQKRVVFRDNRHAQEVVIDLHTGKGWSPWVIRTVSFKLAHPRRVLPMLESPVIQVPQQ